MENKLLKCLLCVYADTQDNVVTLRLASRWLKIKCYLHCCLSYLHNSYVWRKS